MIRELGLEATPANVPLTLHWQINEAMRHRLLNSEQAIIDGRYLGFLGRGLTDILSVRLEATFTLRVERCLARTPEISTEEAAAMHLARRDLDEREIFTRLYGLPDHLSEAFFNVHCQSSEEWSAEQNAEILLSLVRKDISL